MDAGGEVERILVATPLGRALWIGADAEGIALCRFTTQTTACALRAPRHPLLREAARQVAAYFARRMRCFDVPLSLRGTPLQCAMWRAVALLESGTTCSYADVARAVGRPGAHRAAARAMTLAPLALFIPAHRVVGADGRVRGATPRSMRARLLAFERTWAPRS